MLMGCNSSPRITPSPAPPRLEGQIAFQSTRDGNRELYVMQADGTNVRRLTNHPADDITPAWSPDGSQIAFSSNRTGNFEIYLMNGDGSNVRQLTDDPERDYSPSFSADGHSLAFHSYRSGTAQIYTLNIPGSTQTVAITKPRQLTLNPAEKMNPSWSHAQNKIAYEFLRIQRYELYVMNQDGTERAYLGVDGWSPAWAPDGTRLAFVSDVDGTHEVYTVNAGGGNIRRVTVDHRFDESPTWSSDGRWIAFSSDRDGNDEIYAIDPDGKNLTRLTNEPAEDTRPAWSPQ